MLWKFNKIIDEQFETSFDLVSNERVKILISKFEIQYTLKFGNELVFLSD